MKRNKFLPFLTGCVLACLLSFGTMGAMISGLSLPVEDPRILYAAWLAAAVVCCGLFSFKKGWIPVLVLLALAVSLLTKIPEPFQALLARLSSFYNSAYHWGVLEFEGVNWREIPPDLPLICWGCLIALLTAAAVVQGRGLIPAVIAAMLPLGSTVVVTNTVPRAGWIFAAMLGMILLLLPSLARREDPHRGAKVTRNLAVPVAALLWLLFALCPQDTYVNHSEEFLDNTVSWWQSAIHSPLGQPGLLEQTPAGPNASATTNLSRVGPRNTWAYRVLDVEADFTRTVYLRGQDYDSYDGLSWKATTGRAESFGGTPDYGTWIFDGTITVRTPNTSNVLYLPYYPTDVRQLRDGREENEAGLRQYEFGVRHPQDSGAIRFDMPTQSLGSELSRYTGLPSAARRWAVEYLSAHFTTPLLNSADNARIAEAIADHVRGSAVYDTDTPRMSGDYDDFARWFLEESDRGYCVHFASAATVLLRAAGVPARYVTGYTFQTEKDRTVEVTADQAHAWAEYYSESLGTWVVLEATPADLREEEQPETQPLQTQPPTDPPTGETEAPTRPDGTPGPTEPEKPALDLTPVFRFLKWLLPGAGLWLLVQIQYRLRRRLGHSAGGPNRRALAKWRDVELLCRATRQKPPAELEALAQKAKFSQHTLTPEELGRFDAWLKEARSDMEHRPWYIRLLCRYVLAVW